MYLLGMVGFPVEVAQFYQLGLGLSSIAFRSPLIRYADMKLYCEALISRQAFDAENPGTRNPTVRWPDASRSDVRRWSVALWWHDAARIASGAGSASTHARGNGQ